MMDTKLHLTTSAIVVLLAFTRLAYGYPGGAPEEQCDGMTPSHGSYPQTSGSTYTIGVPAMYSCYTPLTVTLGGTSSFKGFFCQARTGVNSTDRLGTFDIGNATNIQLRCDSKAVTHNSDSEKTSVQFTWTPGMDSGNVYIVCTWVQRKNTFWVKEMSTKMMFDTTSTCNTGTTTTAAPGITFFFVMSALVFFVLK